MSPLRWTTKSTRTLAAELTRQGHPVSADTVADLLHEQGFSLQANAKTIEGKQSPDRDAQFRYLNEQVRAHTAAGQPVVSVDTKKKELLGQFANGGREWRPAGNPVRVADHDFTARAPAQGGPVRHLRPDREHRLGQRRHRPRHRRVRRGVAAPLVARRRSGTYPDATRLLITADAGGPTLPHPGCARPSWPRSPPRPAWTITVCHFPPGTSKWNKIEHRLFCHITHNWRGRPLTSHEVVVNTIAATTTRTGLRVHAELDTGTYPLGVTISDEQMAALPLTPHDWHGDWNYTLDHQQLATPTTAATTARPPRRDSTGWAAPALTGMSPSDWYQLTTALSCPTPPTAKPNSTSNAAGPAGASPPAGTHPRSPSRTRS